METVILAIHLILALLLIGVVLLQRNEGGALLSGGGNTQARGQATPLTKLTWLFATAFIATSLTLAIISARDAKGGSVVDTTTTAPVEAPAAPTEADLLPPTAESLLPPTAEVPTEAPVETAPATGETAPEPSN
jgi:preprotein translocase subunit SecG